MDERYLRNNIHGYFDSRNSDIGRSDDNKVILYNGKPIDARQFIFDEKNLLFSYDNEHNDDVFDICKRLFNNKLEKEGKVYLKDILDYLHIDPIQRDPCINELRWNKGDSIDFEAYKIEYLYSYPTEKEGYVLAFSI